MSLEWWKKAVVYQIYPRSFCDSNKDGIGDINGIISKLEYIKELGADVIWLSPVFKSPMRDNGYDISDYRAINPEFGTMADFDNMLSKAHELELKIIMDLAVNHTSDEHPWFKESRSPALDNPKRDYYIWRDGINDGPPNDWIARFTGPAWSYDDRRNQHYLHLFSPWQPDLNWECRELRNEIYDVMRFWLDKGVDGFRLDAISLISKPQDFPNGNEKKLVPNGPRVHEYLQEMRREVLSKYDAQRACVTLTAGETTGVTVDDAIKYANSDGSGLNMVFHFDTVELDGGETFKWNDRRIVLGDLKEVLSRWQTKLYKRAWNSLYWCNHDQPRIVSRLGDEGEHWEKSAKMLATCLHFMQGTPFIYQGEELGMTNAPFAEITDFHDIESINAYAALVDEAKYFTREEMLRYMRLKSRDNARTPMQWSDAPNAGFTKGTPWIMVNPNHEWINVEDQINREGSVFTYYKELIKIRKTNDVVTYGKYELLLPDHSDLFVYLRSFQQRKLLVVCNFSNEDRTYVLPDGFSGRNILIKNDEAERTFTTVVDKQGYKQKPSVVLGAYGAVVYKR
ncbi:MAG: alpha-glucosidase [Treponema sp.]|jgi:oligo-1,6-glucosidase|nr:alpha-glucosidase [Treponema sp.]